MLMFVPSMRYTAQQVSKICVVLLRFNTPVSFFRKLQCLDHEFIAKMCANENFPKELPILESAINNMIRFQYVPSHEALVNIIVDCKLRRI